MSDFLDRLEHELIAAAKRHSSPARQVRRPAQRTLALAIAVTLALAAVAFAATRVFLPGSPVPPTPHLLPNASIGVPSIGHSRLLAASTPDPSGGLPWSMRIVHTSRHMVCLQVGHLYQGQLGVLGTDGAFHDDGRFHPLPASAISRTPHGFATLCIPDVQTVALEEFGMPESGEQKVVGALGQPSRERRLYFGLLGANAVSITYRDGRRLTTVPVERGTGAYLIVLPGPTRTSPITEISGRMAMSGGGEGRLGPSGALTAIRYRVKGRVCEMSWSALTLPPCPHPHPSGVWHRGAPPDLHRTIHVTLQPTSGKPLMGATTRSGRPLAVPLGAVNGRFYDAIVSFRAPFAVTSALSDYSIAASAHVAASARCNRGTAGNALERDVRAGEVVHIRLEDVFAVACGKSVTIEVFYHRWATTPGEPSLRGPQVIVGEATVTGP